MAKARRPRDPQTGVTDQQERFSAELVKTGRPQLAYKIAYDCRSMSDRAAHVEAWRLQQDPMVAARIEHYRRIATAKLEVSVERIAVELARIAFFDPRDLFDDEGRPIPIAELPEDAARVIAGLDVDDLFATTSEDGKKSLVGVTRKYKLASKLQALELLAKWKKMLVEQVEHGKPGAFADKNELRKSVQNRMVRLGLAKVIPMDRAKKQAA